MADFSDLDWAFECPPTVTDQRLRNGYEILVARFRGEGEHLPLNTAFQLKIERTINAYIRNKQAELVEVGKTGGYKDSREELEFNRFVQGCLNDVSEMLRRNIPNADRELVMAEVKDILVTVMRGIPDSDVRDDLSRRLAAAFERAGF